jgi:2-keto-4-pentenoate hydratase/2-oxohepta-3-ene-1,7-dioic acid hydratase in catechol pathway
LGRSRVLTPIRATDTSAAPIQAARRPCKRREDRHEYQTLDPLSPRRQAGLLGIVIGETVPTLLDGAVRQDYPLSDMHFSVEQLASLIPNDLTLPPGDFILCGPSLGIGSMKAGSTVEVESGGIGRLSRRFEPTNRESFITGLES